MANNGSQNLNEDVAEVDAPPEISGAPAAGYNITDVAEVDAPPEISGAPAAGYNITDSPTALHAVTSHHPAPPAVPNPHALDVAASNFIDNLNQLFAPVPGSGYMEATSIQDPVQYQQQIDALQPDPHALHNVAAPNFIDNLNQVFPPVPGSGYMEATSIQDPVQYQQQIDALQPGNVDEGTDDVADSSPESEATH